MVVPLRSQVRLRLSRLSVQHGRSASSHRPALTLARCSVAAHCASLRVLATPALRASDVRPSLAHWAYYGLFPPQAAAFVRPLQFPLKSYGFPGAETAKKRFLLWKMGFSAAAYCESMHPSIQHGRPTALAGSLAALPASLGLLRPASAVHAAGDDFNARGLRPSRALPWFFR